MPGVCAALEVGVIGNLPAYFKVSRSDRAVRDT